MYVEKETEKAYLVCRDAVSFWIQKRWLSVKGGNMELTKAGWKAYHIAAREHWKHFGYDAMKEFAAVRETGKAVLLRCAVELPGGGEEEAEFWLPKALTGDWRRVSKKIGEIERGYPFEGTKVRWSGMKEGNVPRGGRASAKSGGTVSTVQA
jgi:hypothetical protein